MKKISKYLPHVAAMLFLAGFVSYAAWTEPPTGTTPPDNNVPAPINVGSSSQTFLDSKTLRVKSDGSGVINLEGGLGVGGLFRSFYTAVFDGNVGIGTIPSQLLHLKSIAGDAAIRLQTNITPADQIATFNYTGGLQTWVVPSWVSSINVDVRGAGGGNGGSAVVGASTVPGGVGGRGAQIQGTISVTPGETLYIYVGGNGASGFNGGGLGGACWGANGGSGGVGGGASAISGRVVAAGGGGGGGASASCTGCSGGNGGPGDTNGVAGWIGNGLMQCSGQHGGGGGTQTAGGSGGSGGDGACAILGGSGTAGSSAMGGIGGYGPSAIFSAGGGGGGGGGYYGGGGGGGGGASGYYGSSGAGGGGGSSLVPVGSTVTQGFQSGDGQIIITYSSNPDTNWILGAGPATNGKFKISNSSAFGTTDALVLDDQGIILKAFNGSNCYRLRVDNTGVLSAILVACP